MAEHAAHLDATPVEQATFRTVLGHFATGITVVAGMVDGAPAGFSCQSVFSLSLDPPLVALAPSLASTSWRGIQASGAFCVNVLTDQQEAICRVFAQPGVATDKFLGIGWSPGPTGSPRLDDVLAWVDCRVDAVHDGGDHLLVVGAVAGLGTGGGEPLLFYRGGFGAFRP
jgi:3-hydroxy-9,10-secoandrosta-1,3,5(10)-triene-9,17-dione monooxygenase reductase component